MNHDARTIAGGLRNVLQDIAENDRVRRHVPGEGPGPLADKIKGALRGILRDVRVIDPSRAHPDSGVQLLPSDEDDQRFAALISQLQSLCKDIERAIGIPDNAADRLTSLADQFGAL